jgi:hypothetical protein
MSMFSGPPSYIAYRPIRSVLAVNGGPEFALHWLFVPSLLPFLLWISPFQTLCVESKLSQTTLDQYSEVTYF